MPLVEILIGTLGAPLAKLLLKNYLEDPAEAIGLSLIDLAKKKIEGRLEQRAVQRQFEDLGDKIAAQLASVLRETDDVAVESIAHELSKALDGHLSSEFFLTHDLDPARLAVELRRVHPLPKGQFSAAEEQLYDRALVEIARYVVEIVSKLPKFEVTSIKVSLQRLTHIGDIVEETAKSVRQIENWVRKQESDTENQGYETEYRLAVGRTLDYVELFGADLSMESKRQSLSVAYVSLNLESSTGRGEEEGSESFPVKAVLDSMSPDAGRLLIRGEAGSGKSTLFRWTAIEASKGIRLPVPRIGKLIFDETNVSDLWQAKIPFLIRLRDCKGGKLPPPDDFPEMIAKELGEPPSNWVRQVLRAGRGLVLLDGIDEIPNLHRETARREIEAVVQAYPASYFLVSTRPEAIPEGWLAGLDFREARVNPMSDLDRERFIDKWHEAVAEQLERMGRSGKQLPELAAELKRQLLENPPVARLATNPLLCAMICALHRDRSQKLPESQSELCEALCEVLLHRREWEGGLDLSSFPEPYRCLTYPQKRAIVREIAHYMILNGESSITLDRAREKVADALRSLSEQSEEDAEVVCQALVERSGMLRETKPGHIDFIHNTFKEYLAADAFVDSKDAGFIARQALEDPVWQRVALFAVATRRRGFADELIERILKTGSGTRFWKTIGSESTRERQLLALRCKAAALFVAPELEEKLQTIAETLFPPQGMDDAEALATAGDAFVALLGYRTDLKAHEAAACVRALRLIGTQRARSTLEEYIDDRRDSVVSELAQALNPLLLPGIQVRVEAGLRLAPWIASQVSDLSPLLELDDLQSLDIAGTQAWDFSSLSRLMHLEQLDLSNTRLVDLSPLSNLRRLQKLDLSETQVSDISVLSGIRDLQILYLGGTKVSDLSPLSSLSGLEILVLRETQVSDLSPLSGLLGLRDLNLSGTQVMDLSPLSGLDGLRWLNLSGTRVSDLSPLSALSSLERIVVDSGVSVPFNLKAKVV
ncbi:MAG TPA: leucine-rich repeat domain-containing protein [Thermoanaerobaculia bacterium]|nr:leucine-rich repeat domain-containing protein [Thermoanaerobaculia bacterium]